MRRDYRGQRAPLDGRSSRARARARARRTDTRAREAKETRQAL